ncbi:MAG: NAD-dependent epimerase/dehydratase family protein [bacterium]|nr:NAD-dependent epimerase/dehydratase family protein [bacterium]
MRIFVTGGNGFIGAVVVKKLIEQNHHVICLLRKTSDVTRIKNLPYTKTIGDVRDLDSIQKGMMNCDAAIHLASLSNWNDICSPLMPEVVVGGSNNVLISAAKMGNLKTVFVSSIAAINGTKNPQIQNEMSTCTLNLEKYSYAKAKIDVEELCLQAHENGLPVVIVNPSEVYGPNDTSLNTAGNLIDFAKSSPVLVCHGGTSIVHVDDVADGIIAALHKGQSGERYILGGENLTVKELALHTLNILGLSKKILQIPNGLLLFAAKTADIFRLPFPINPKVVPYATLYWFADNQKARRDLGVNFRNAQDTLLPTLKWLQETKRIKTTK